MGLAIGIALVLLLLYKHSFIRQDLSHAPLGPATALAAVVLYLPVMWRGASSRWRIGMLAALGLAVMFFGSILSDYTPSNLFQFAEESFSRCGRNVIAAAEHVTDPNRLTRQWESAGRELRTTVPLPLAKITGTVDVYPHREDVLFAYDLPYAPRPICSSYLANMPALATLNAQHLSTAAAAQTILFGVETVDHKYPSTLDGASWPLLLARYALIDDTGGLLVLRKRDRPRGIAYSPLATFPAHFDERIAVPTVSDGMIWMRVDFHKRLLGRLIAAAYKPAMVSLTVTTADGLENEYRLLPDLAGQGFLLSPLVDDRLAFAGLIPHSPAPFPTGKAVRSIKIGVFDGSQDAAFDPQFTVTFNRLQILPPP
jgi:hypothetical protein